MAVVARVLLDHVQVDPADGLLADQLVERYARGGGPTAIHLLAVGRKDGRRGGGVQILDVALGPIVAVVDRLDLWTLQATDAATEPTSLDVGQVPDQAQQRQRGRFGGAELELVVAESRAFIRSVARW